MSEFEFLEKMFRRLSEAKSLRHHDEKTLQPVKVGRKMVTPHSAFETAELMIKHSIQDYLKTRREEQK